MGVELRLDAKVDDVEAAMSEGAHDTAFLAVGAHIGKRAYIPAGGAAKILDAASLLRSMEGEAPPLLGRKVVIYGGGNTALDAARTARRLGADEAIIVYRRTREKMPAHDFELEEALQEGVSMRWLSTIKSVDGGSMTIERMKLDDTGFPQPTGEFETLEADSLVLALGQDVDLSLLDNAPGIAIENGVVKVGPDMMTGRKGVFAGGDMAPSERTVTVAVGHGKKAARCVDAYLRGETYAPPPKHGLASFERLNAWYYEDAPGTVRPTLEAVRRVENFEEIVKGLDEPTRSMRRADASPAAIASNATIAMASAPTTPSSSSAPASASGSISTIARAAASAPPNARAARSTWSPRRFDEAGAGIATSGKGTTSERSRLRVFRNCISFPCSYVRAMFSPLRMPSSAAGREAGTELDRTSLRRSKFRPENLLFLPPGLEKPSG